MIYTIVKFILKVAFKILFRCKIYSLENVPNSGGAILAANHTSLLDPFLLGIPIPRKIYFFGRSSLFRPRLWGWFLKQLHTVPVEREKPTPSSIKRIFKLLKSGEILVLFPEGTRGSGKELGEARGGVGMIVARSRVPVIPAYVSGAARILPRGAHMIHPAKVKIIYGQALDFAKSIGCSPSKADFQYIGNRVMEAIAELKTQVEE